MSEMEDDNIDLFPQPRADQRKPSVAKLVIDSMKSRQPPGQSHEGTVLCWD